MDQPTATHVIADTAERSRLLVIAQRLAIFTIAWNVTEGIVAITAATLANSQALIGFGLDSAVESISASVLLWRLNVERRNPERAERVEHIATRVIGVSFLLLAAFVAYDAINALVDNNEPDTSIIGIALTATSLMVMPILARRKKRVAIALASKAAEADSNQTWACVWLSAVVLGGLVLNAAFGWWWADPIAALGVVVFLGLEGREALTADSLDDCC
ncbi:MAG: cation diffusion facilitator family transporter [Ilumatobacter sp.]|uniref:cation diffusion facilitator family transporter n=1 Tax=Ilumatobacter sp. TaxID=1967498 RepID=UPI00391B5309